MNSPAASAVDARFAGERRFERTDPARSCYSDRRCDDADEHAAALRDWDQTYDQLSTGRFDGQVTEAWMGGIQMFRERTAPVTQQRGRSWPGACTLALVLSAESEATFCGQSIAASQGALFGAGGEFTLIAPRRFEIVGIAVQADLLRSHAATTGDAALATVAGTRAEILPDCTVLAPMRTCARDWFDALDRDPTLVEQPAVRASLLSSVLGVLGTLADAPSGASSGAGLLPDARARLVERARQRIAAQPDTPYTVAELCADLGVSRRTLQYSFQQVLGVNPVQYLRAVRLNGVRRALKTAEPGARIGDIAARWGFWHLSQFSADYRRMFGELPSETLRARG